MTYEVPILLYHSLEEGVPEKSFGKMIIPAESLKRQVAYLVRRNRPIQTVQELVLKRKEGVLPKRSVVLTFDDGFQTVYIHAYPILRDLGVAATLFVATRNVGKEGYLTWDQIREMNRGGMEIGSHTQTHVWLPKLSESKAQEEIEGSKKKIDDELGRAIFSFSYPLGGFNRRLVEMVQESGYEAACVTRTIGEFAPDYPFTLRRIKIAPSSNFLPYFAFKSSGYYYLFQ